MSKAIVSVVVPTKNSAATLDACLNSITTQTYPKIEVIVVDNFSTDKTPSIANKYTKLTYPKGPERSSQRNYGVSKANGKYVFIIDSDMVLSPTVVENCVRVMESKNEVAAVVVPEESFGEGFWAQCKKLERSFYIGVPFMEAARFFRRSDYIKIGGFDETLNGNEDWDLSQRMGKLGRLGRIDALIYHNEGHMSLRKTMKKKYYYVQRFSEYRDKHKSSRVVKQQASPTARYRLFLSHPVKLFRNPALGLGMLFMKTCEFGFGAIGYLRASRRSHV